MICTQANEQVGVGHVTRCIALAQAWKARGGRCIFFGVIDAGSLRNRLLADGYEVFEPSPGPSGTVFELKGLGTPNVWVVLDGYHFGPEWQDALVDSGFLVLCVDDGARLPQYRAQVILAPDCTARPMSYKTAPSSLILAGPRYRLLRQDMTGQTERSTDVSKTVVLVTFGGCDASNVTLDVVRALDRILKPNDHAIVVLGPANRHRTVVQEALKEVAYRRELLQDVVDMTALYARADVAISAAGGTAWEIAAAGLPAILIPVAANQEPGAEFLVREGAAIRIDGPAAIHSESFLVHAKCLLADQKRLAKMSASGRTVCDRKGAQRVISILTALKHKERAFDLFQVRRSVSGDMEQVFRLANDPDVRTNSFSPAPIVFEDHARWFAARIESPDAAIFVLDLEGLVVAMVRYDRAAEEAEIDIAVLGAFRGRGLGTHILQTTVSAATRSLAVLRLRAVVLERNWASRNFFVKAGFSEAGPEYIKENNCRIFTRDAE